MPSLISVVVPTHNERDNIAILYQRLAAVFGAETDDEMELLFVDDSTDETPDIIKGLIEKDERVKLIRLVRSFGQSAAIAAGLKRAAGDAVILMDADLQDPPEVIPTFLEKWREGNKVVYAQRPSQSASFLYKVLARLFYKMLAVISDVEIPVDAGEFRLIDRAVVDFLNALNERSRFLRGLTVWPGFKSDKVEIIRGDRLSGSTNYNFAKSLTVALDGFVSFSTAPLRLATLLGMVSAGAAVLLGLVYLFLWFVDRSLFGAGWMSLFLIILLVGSMNLFCLGIIGEYIGRVFAELQKRPLYLVDYQVGAFHDEEKPPKT